MARPSKLTPDIQKRIGDNIALGPHTGWLQNQLVSHIKHSMNI